MAADEQRLRVAVLGAGLIGIDLADKIRRSKKLELALVAGRGRDSLGLRRAADMGHPTTDGGIHAVAEGGPSTRSSTPPTPTATPSTGPHYNLPAPR
ncbi:hypothetical protein SHKM778_67400 [Streptomyces sp. KM77-8]|uniref:Uncharacterized protein n=1 Tax=Streptomyces haneummycinicus TaxID=3074435 RepID=A0AAT9HSL6_9ACTN